MVWQRRSGRNTPDAVSVNAERGLVAAAASAGEETMTRRVEINAGSDLEEALANAEASGDTIELVHNGRTYRLVPIGTPLDPAERARRDDLVARTLVARNRQRPLGISTAELIREVRSERYGE
jgi:hypothetical protein